MRLKGRYIMFTAEDDESTLAEVVLELPHHAHHQHGGL